MANTKSLTQTQRVRKLTGMALITALIVVLQVVAAVLPKLPGGFSITLTLVPIVVGAAMYGSGAGAYFGAVFGVITLIGCINGSDPGGNMLWNSNPFVTAALCLVKAAAAGFAAGGVYQLVSKKHPYLAIILAAVVCPTVNTGIFLCGMFLFFRDTLTIWAGGKGLLFYAITGLAGVNYLIELGINLVLNPVIYRIIRVIKKM